MHNIMGNTLVEIFADILNQILKDDYKRIN